jgi:serpin B
MIRYMIVLTILIAGSACSKNQTAAAEPGTNSSSSANQESQIKFEQQNNALSFKLWQELDQDQENLFFSPYSINTALGMVYAGARGNTAREIAKAMGYELWEDKQHQVFGQYQTALNAIAKREKAEFDIANALFAAQKNEHRLIPDYLDLLQDSFASELYSLDFDQAAQSADFINRWVEKQTNERIKDMVSERQIAQSNHGMVLVNAIYFKGNWLHKFPLESTYPSRFYRDSRRTPESAIDFDMMQIKANFRYAEMPGYQILELPYEEEELSMILVLPNEIKGIASRLDTRLWQKWLNALKNQEVRVYLPRFKLEQSLEGLVSTFQKLGIQDAFDPYGADFSGIMKYDRSQNLFIAKISHKAFLEIKEEGTEAAAATQVGFATTSMAPNPVEIPTFRADIPFLCMIVHKPDNNILFLGKVMDPDVIE